jgi:hypothetical protein
VPVVEEVLRRGASAAKKSLGLDDLSIHRGTIEASFLRNPTSMSRKEKILAMLADEPNDSFLRYSLAMELRKEQDHEESIRILRELAYDPQANYVAAFFMAARQLADYEQIEQARALLRDGIEEARTQNNLHAAAEMSELLSDLGK